MIFKTKYQFNVPLQTFGPFAVLANSTVFPPDEKFLTQFVSLGVQNFRLHSKLPPQISSAFVALFSTNAV